MAGDAGSVDVRLAVTAAEIAGVYAVRHEVFVEGQGVPADLERDAADSTADHLLAGRDERVIGAGRLVVAGSVGVLGRLAVLEAARGRGVGAALVDGIERRARERGCRVVELHAQVYVREFYEGLGYAAYGEVFEEAGIPHISMRKRLGPDTPG